MSHGSYDLNLVSKRLILAGYVRLISWPNIGDLYGIRRTSLEMLCLQIILFYRDELRSLSIKEEKLN
jgi:hypothetical protein